MAVLAVNNPNNNAGVQATPTAAASTSIAAPDTFQAGFGQKYLLEIINTSGASRTVTINDPDVANPGAYKALDRDMDVVLATNQTRVIVLDGTRFRDANGNIGVAVNNVTGVSYNVFGPL
jgi:hypothetical protein